MKALKSLALAGVLLLCALTPAASKTITITNDDGGIVVSYIRKYSDIRDAGEKVVVDGNCISSCTLLIGLLRPENVCVTDNAVFGFHSASLKRKVKGQDVYVHAPEMSEMMYSLYPGDVRQLLRARGWDGYLTDNAHPDIIWVSGSALKSIVRECTPADLS
jgi:hypothetical protein